MNTTIGTHVVGQFSFLALHPFDTRVIWSLNRESGNPEAVKDLLNRKNLAISPDSFAFTASPLTFEVVRLNDIFTDSPNATWSMLQAGLPDDWFKQALAKGERPLEVQLTRVNASLRLFHGGMAIIVVEPTYTIHGPPTWTERFPDLIKKTADQSVRYKNSDVKTLCKNLTNAFATSLQRAVCLDGSEIAPAFQPLVTRIRRTSVPEAYPTIITKIWWKDPAPPSRYLLKASDLTRAMYLDASELVNALPTFEDDFIAVGYDSAWWLRAARQEERTERFPERVELTFQYALAVSMLIYVLHTEIDQELPQIRSVRADTEDSALAERQRTRARRLRAEVEDLLKEISLESFSTWVSDIHLFRTIMQNWLVDTSRAALKAKIDAVNVILSESEQRDLTYLSTIFAAAGLAGVFVAAVTLLFTQTQWEVQDPTLARALLALKIMVASYLLVLPVPLLWLASRWRRQLSRAFKKLRTNNQ
ncbi:MAG: hypothetical protein HYS14_08350 [Candidatus Rokubacteria bacterium]|nr:hypothetical protein [Candidatus Rokubacteria bacterium]